MSQVVKLGMGKLIQIPLKFSIGLCFYTIMHTYVIIFTVNTFQDLFKSGYFYIEGSFYNDSRDLNCRDYSK